MKAHIKSALEGSSTLSEVECLAPETAVDGKNIVVGVGNVTSPERNGDRRKVNINVSPHDSIKVLTITVGQIPIGLALCIYIQSAFDISADEKKKQETASLFRISDMFKKVIIQKQDVVPHFDEDGILICSLKDFLLKTEELQKMFV